MNEGASDPSWVWLARENWRFRGATAPRFAEPKTGDQESVWEYPRPPIICPDSRIVRVSLGGVLIAETTRALRLLETSHAPGFYIPRADVDPRVLHSVPVETFCEWKGTATYFDVDCAGGIVKSRAWTYEKPFREFEKLAGYVSFYPDFFDCTVDGERVRPQKGWFYAGWITDDVVGPFKGGPGSDDW